MRSDNFRRLFSRFRVVFNAVDVHAYGWCIHMARDNGRHLQQVSLAISALSGVIFSSMSMFGMSIGPFDMSAGCPTLLVISMLRFTPPMARLCPDDHCGPSGLFHCRSMCSKRSSGLLTRLSGHPLDPSAQPPRRSTSSIHRFASSRRLNESLAHPACSLSSGILQVRIYSHSRRADCFLSGVVPFARTTTGLRSPFRRPC